VPGFPPLKENEKFKINPGCELKYKREQLSATTKKSKKKKDKKKKKKSKKSHKKKKEKKQG